MQLLARSKNAKRSDRTLLEVELQMRRGLHPSDEPVYQSLSVNSAKGSMHSVARPSSMEGQMTPSTQTSALLCAYLDGSL